MSSASQEPNGELRRNSRTTMFWMIGGVCLAALVALGGVINWLNNLTADIKSHEAAIQEIRVQNQRSSDDRVTLGKQVDDNKEVLNAIKEGLAKEIAVRNADWQEIETQLDATNQSTNLQVAELHRLLSISWPREIGVYPAVPLTQPNISNRRLKE